MFQKRLFNARTGRKAYLAVLPIVLLFFLGVHLVGMILFLPLTAGMFASRLNDIGWSRWHAAWLTAWGLLAKLILMAPPPPPEQLQARGLTILVTVFPFLILAVLLGFPKGENGENRFGRPPLSWREFWAGWKARKQFRETYRATKPAVDALMVEMKAAQAESARLSAEYQVELKVVGVEGARAKRAELDTARAQFNAALAQLQAAQAELRPSMDAMLAANEPVRRMLESHRRS
jgi:uncharacterized membrane protein YhaH (DUF805 family)